MNKVFKKNRCGYTSTGLFKRFQANKWTVDWTKRWEDTLKNMSESDYNSVFLCDLACDPLEAEAEECFLNFYKDTDHLSGKEYISRYSPFIKDMRDKYGDELVIKVRKSLSKKHW